MAIIDRYLLRQFFKSLVICYLSLLGLYVVFDAFTNLDAFLKAAAKQGSLAAVMGRYYGCHALLFFDLMAGLVNLAAAMFTLAWIQRHNELVALMAAGISRLRVAAPVVAAGVMVIGLAAANRELLIPRFRSELSRKPHDLAADGPRPFSSETDEHDILIRGQAAILGEQKILKPKFRFPASLDHYARHITAREAVYHAPQGDRPGGYLLMGVEYPKDLGSQPSLVVDGSPVVITPRDAPDWLQADQCFLATDLSFEQLVNGQGWRKFSSTAQLVRALRSRSFDLGGSIRVTIHSRMVQPLLDLTLLFLGLPLVLARQSRNVFVAMGLCAAVTSAFMLVVITFQYLGTIYAIRPALAAWIPLMIFVPLAVEMAPSMAR